jgi:hypothetical protein
VARAGYARNKKYNYFRLYNQNVNRNQTCPQQATSNWHHKCFKESKETRKRGKITQITSNIKENIMRTNTLVNKETQTNIGYETSIFALGTGLIMALLVGLWASACMINALLSYGIGDVVKGFITAITGI